MSELTAALSSLIAARRPGWSLPRPFYTDETIFAADLENVYMRQWLYAGHVSQVQRAGDYFTFELGDESLLIIRQHDDPDGGIHALFNVCRHRGSRICTERAGHTKKLVCPYHQWVYGTDGALLAARGMPADFNKQNFGLKRANVRVLEGLIFVSLSASPPDFAAFANDVESLLQPHGFPRAKICFSHTYLVHSNWKLIVENSRECYHCHAGHPEYCSVMFPPGNMDGPAREKQFKERMDHYANIGLASRQVEGESHHASRYPFGKAGYVSESLDGKPVAPLMGKLTEPDAGVLGVVLFPNFMFEACGDHAVAFRFMPVSARVTQVQAQWFVRADATEGKDYHVGRVTDFWKTTGEQDWKLCEDNQAGVNSTRYESGPYGEEEAGVERFVKWYLKALV